MTAPRVDVDTTAAHRTLQRVARAVSEAVTVTMPGLLGAARAFGEALDSLGRALPTPPPEPVDPMARALYLRQHRNTGPQVHADPRRNRR